jgi:Zn finger protein HypA/HybF involved in hydrogenase expression
MNTGKHSTVAAKQKQLEMYIKRVDAYNINPNRCKNCNSVLPYERRNNKYCNHSCAASMTNLGTKRNKPKTIARCVCGNVLTHGRSKYCSMACQEKVYLDKMASGEVIPSKGTLRRIVIRLRGYRCEDCGLSEWLGKKLMLELHHVDGDHGNRNFDNLLLLCPNCHSITDNHKGRKKRTSGLIGKAPSL